MSGTHCSHRWAHNEDPDKTGKTGNMHFHGMSFYSYGTVIAVKYPKRKTVVFAGEGIWNSGCTLGHKSWARSALPSDWKTLSVDCDRYGHLLESMAGIRKCHDKMVCGLQTDLETVLKSRKGKSQSLRYQSYVRRVEHCNEVAEFLHRKPIVPKAFDAEFIAGAEAEIKRIEAAVAAKKRAKERANEKLRLQKQAEELANVELWRKRELTGSTHWFEGTFLRMSKCGKFVETSRGAVVPREDALKLLKACRIYVRTKPEGELYPSGERVGDYRLFSIDKDGNATVGCHFLTLEEMERCFADAVAASDDPAMLLMAVE